MEALILFVKTFGPEALLILVGAGLLVFLIIYIISAITGRNFGIEIGPFKFNTKKNGNGSDPKIEKIKTLLQYNNRDTENSLIDSIINTIKTKTRSKDIVEFQQTVINQMTCAEDFNIQIKALMTESFARLLKEKDSTIDVRQHKDYRYYQILVSSILDELKRNTLKESVKSMDIVALSTQDFEQFADQKINVMITHIIEFIDLMYQSNSIVTRDEVHKEHEAITPKIKDLYRTLYYKIKTIVAEDNKNMQEIVNQMDNEVSGYKSQIEKSCIANKINTIVAEDKPEEKKG